MQSSCFVRGTGVAALIVAATLFAACGKKPADYFASGQKYVAEKKHREAIVEFRNAVQGDPRLGPAHKALAESYMAVQEFDRALAEYVKAAELLPDDLELQLNAARILVLARHFDEARVCVDRALKKDPGNVVARVLRANALAGLKEFDEALAAVQEAVKLDPTRSTTHAQMGVIELAGGDTSKAEESFRKAVEVEPKSPDARVALASYYWSVSRMADAERELKAAVALQPTHVNANRALAALYIATDRVDQAEQNLKAIVEADRSAGAKLMLADYYIGLNRPADATPILKSVATVREAQGDALSRLAAIDYAAGRKADAYKTLEEALKNNPTHPRVLLTRGQFQLVENKVDDAWKSVRAAVAADPGDVPARSTLGLIHQMRQEYDEAAQEFTEVLRLDPKSAMAKVELAQVNLARGEAAAAVDFAQNAVAALPQDLNVRALYVRSLIAKGDYQRANVELRPLLVQAPSVAQLHYLSGVIQRQQNNLAGAREAFERSLALKGNSLEPLDELVGLDLYQGKIEHARGLVETRLQAQPNSAALLVLLARIEDVSRHPDKVEAALKKAIDADVSNRQPYEMLGRLYLSQGRKDEALSEYERIAMRDPKSASAHTMIGMIQHSQGKIDEAVKSYQKAMDANPNAVVAINNLAWIYADRGENLDVALQLAQNAKALVPDSPDVNDTLGFVYLKKDLAQLAVTPLRACVEKDPKNVGCHYHLGLAYAKTGDATRARGALQAALNLDPKFEGAESARTTLSSLAP